MGRSTMDLGVRIAADVKGLRAGFSQIKGELGNLRKAADGFTSSLRTGVAGLIGGIGAVSTIRAVTRATIAQERAERQLEARLRATGESAGFSADQLKRMASEMQSATTFGDELVIEAQAIALQFTNLHGDVFKRTIEAAADVASALGTDLPSATQQLARSLNDPMAGMRSLRELGVTFTDDQRKVIQSLVETGQVAAAQDIILRRLESTFGGAAAAARNTLGGAIDSLKNAFGDLLEGDAGGDGVRGATDAINGLAELLNSPEVKSGFQVIVEGALAAVGALARFVTTTAEVMKFVGEEIAARVAGPAIDDIVRTEQALDRLENRIRSRATGRSDASLQRDGYYQQLLTEREELQRRLEVGRQLEAEALARARRIAEAAAADVRPPVITPASQPGADGTGGRTSSQRDVFAAQEEALRRQIDLYGETGEAARIRYEIEQGALQSLDAAQKQQILNLADKLDALRAETEERGRITGLQREAEALVQATYTAEERYVQLVIRLDELMAEHVITLEERTRILEHAAAQMTKRIEEASTELERFGAAAGHVAIGGLTNFFTDVASGAKSAGDAFKDFVRDFAAGMAQMAARALATIAVLQIMEALFPGSARLLAASYGGAGVYHQGGIVRPGGAPTRQVAPWTFASAPRYHQGGFAGLKPGEVPAVLQTGEEVLARDNPRNALNGGASATPVQLRTIILDDQRRVADFINTPPGEEAILQVIQRNQGAVQEILRF